MNVSLDAQKMQDSIPMTRYDVVVMGAGPYGLSAAAHLLGRGLKVAVFGKPIHFWRANMPEGMLLRSFWWATRLSDPKGEYSFERYFQVSGEQATDPLPIETFINYGLWFQKNAVPDVDETYITCIERQNDHFVVTLEDGRTMQSKTVVMAPGLHYYLHVPTEYSHLPSTLVSHSAEHYDLSRFSGKKVAVIGGGQAALETAALLHERGADALLITRKPLHWIPLANPKIPALLRTLRAPKAGMGDGWLNLLLEKFPYVFQRAPRDMRDHVLDTRHGPAGSNWLKERILGKLPVYEGASVEKVEEINGRVQLSLAGGETLDVEHVILGTGYRADVKRLPMLHASLRNSLWTYKGSPVLSSWFESSVPGLYFLGFSAVRSFGPFYRFVVGAPAAARRVSASIAQLVLSN